MTKITKINIRIISKFAIYTLLLIALSFFCREVSLLLLSKGQFLESPIFSLHFVKNTGAAFSLLHSQTRFLIYLSGLISAVILIYVVKNSNRISNLKLNALILITAGIIGNLYERIVNGYVTDYIDLKFIDFPVFNVSDIFITMGALLLIVVVLKSGK